jgi:hypothetical protein
MTEYKLLTAKEYAKHLKDYCQLKDFEVELVLQNVYKRAKEEKDLKKTYKKQR